MKGRLPYVAVGAFVLVALVGVIAAVAVLQGRTGATDTYYARFGDVTGIKFGTQVLYQGYAVGQVEEVEPADGTPRFRVRLSVRRGWPIERDAEVRVTQGGSFLSALVLDIRGGESAERLAPGDEIATRDQADLFQVISDAAAELQTLMDTAVRPVVETVGEEIPALLGNLRDFSEQLQVAGTRLNDVLAQDNVDRIRNVVVNVERVSGDVAAITADLGETRQRMDSAIATFQRLAEENEGDLRQAARDLQYTLEAVAARIDAVTYNLEATTRNMNEFSRTIRGNPGTLLRGGAPREDGDAGQ